MTKAARKQNTVQSSSVSYAEAIERLADNFAAPLAAVIETVNELRADHDKSRDDAEWLARNETMLRVLTSPHLAAFLEENADKLVAEYPQYFPASAE